MTAYFGRSGAWISAPAIPPRTLASRGLRWLFAAMLTVTTLTPVQASTGVSSTPAEPALSGLGEAPSPTTETSGEGAAAAVTP